MRKGAIGEPCEYCGADDWTITATMIGCDGCGAIWGRCNGLWIVDPETVPSDAADAGLTMPLNEALR